MRRDDRQLRQQFPAALLFWVFCVSLGLLGDQAAIAAAENWPGWRKDGSGVSRETGLPNTWSETDNVRWKTPIPGKGNSSPIVWNDRVFLTTSVPGTARHTMYHVAMALIWGLTLVALWQYLGGSLRDPLPQRMPGRATQNASIYALRRLLLVPLCILMAYFLLKAIHYHVPKALPAGVLCAFAMLLLSHLVDATTRSGQRHSSPPQDSGRLLTLVHWLEALSILGLTGAFLLVTHCYLAADFSYSPDRTWFSCATICSIGLMVAIGSIPRRSAWRVVMAAGALLLLPVFAFACPTSDVPLPAPDQYYFRIFLAFAAMTVLVSGWSCLEFVFYRRKASKAPPAVPLKPVGPLAILSIGFLLFVSMNYFLPRSVWSRQLICLDGATGDVAWQTTCCIEDENAGLHVLNTLAAPTPVTDGERVYAHFGGAGAYCVNFSGQILWHCNDPVKAIPLGRREFTGTLER